MKGYEQIIATLNSLLANELTAINQYMVHAEMCENWGYSRLHKIVQNRAIDEMKHAEMLIARIIFLEGSPTVNVLRELHIGATVETQLTNDHHIELKCVEVYNDAIKEASDLADSTTRQLLEQILKTEENEHIDWLEAQLDQISQMGIAAYLAEQTEK